MPLAADRESVGAVTVTAGGTLQRYVQAATKVVCEPARVIYISCNCRRIVRWWRKTRRERRRTDGQTDM